MDDIKSAFERAMERIANLEEPSKDEVMQWKYTPEGQKLAVKYFKEDINLVAELGKFKEEEKRFVAKGAEEVLLRNITLPANEPAKKATKKAMESLRTVVDTLEIEVDERVWPLPKYRDMLFIY
jgi:glutamine synthetase type III